MGGKGYKRLIAILLVCSCLQSCIKDKPPVRSNTAPSAKKGVFIVCEGQYTVGNAALYLYQPNSDSVFGDLYQAINHRQLGDVFQSMAYSNGSFLLTINNSHKVIRLDTAALQQSGLVSIRSPRYMTETTNGRVWISTLYSNKIYVLDVAAMQLIDSIVLPSLNAEMMYAYENDVFVGGWDTSNATVYRVDKSTYAIKQRIAIDGRAPHTLLMDKENMLWVLSGNQPQGKRAQLTKIDPSTGNVLVTYPFPTDAEPIKPIFNSTKDTLYFIGVNYAGGTANNGIYRMGIHERYLPTQPIIKAAALQYYWALGIHPATGHIYVGDPKGFNQNGSVTIYNTNFTPLTTFKVGVGPSSFVFY